MQYLRLFHGRHTPDEQLSDWGFDGPIFACVSGVSVTYACEIKFENQDDELCVLKIVDDLVYYNDCWYGDFEIISDSEQNIPDLDVFDETKAQHDGWHARVRREAKRRQAKKKTKVLGTRNLKLRAT